MRTASSVTTSSNQQKNPFAHSTSNYVDLVFEVSKKDMEKNPQGGHFTLHMHHTSGDLAVSH